MMGRMRDLAIIFFGCLALAITFAAACVGAYHAGLGWGLCAILGYGVIVCAAVSAQAAWKAGRTCASTGSPAKERSDRSSSSARNGTSR